MDRTLLYDLGWTGTFTVGQPARAVRADLVVDPGDRFCDGACYGYPGRFGPAGASWPGGWCLSGEDEGDWQADLLVFDLEAPSAKWQTIEQPFERRALATSHVGGDLFVIGGMNADHEIERTVNVYSPATGKWSQVADLPGEGMNGFGVSAWNARGILHVSGSNGSVDRIG